jgi:hypothetical protein
MTTYRLTKRSSNKLITEFHVLDANHDVIGSISIPPQEEADLLRHWTGPHDQQQPKLKAPPPLMGRMPRQMVLRGC